MFADKRLTKAYNNSKVEYFDENSKYVIFSDCHRGVGSLSDEFTKNQNTFIHAIKHYYNNGFTYVEAGDGDELWEHPNLKLIFNAHYGVFRNIKRFHDDNRLVMIYGNHNNYLKNDKYVKKHYYEYYNEFKEECYDFLDGLIPYEGLVLRHKRTKQEIFICHGHQGDLANDQLWFLSMLSLKYFWRFFHALGAKNPSSPVKNEHKRHKLEKNYIKWIKKNKKIFICGHTHRYKFPKKDDLPYFNAGCCIYPTSITAIEIENGQIQIVSWRVYPDEKGSLEIVKRVIRGPEPIEKFDIR